MSVTQNISQYNYASRVYHPLAQVDLRENFAIWQKYPENENQVKVRQNVQIISDLPISICKLSASQNLKNMRLTVDTIQT